MLDSLLKGLKDQISGEILNKVGLDTSKTDEVVAIAGESTKEVMGNELLSGGLGNIMNLFSSQQNNSAADSLQNSLVNNLVGKFATKLGLDQSMATMLASFIVPKIIDFISNKNEETPETDSSALSEMFGGGNIADKAKDMLGGLFG